MGSSGKFAIGAFLAALALLALAGITLHETMFLWFLAAAAAAYVACVSEVVIRRRHRTLAASGIGSTLFIAFSISFLRQWGLAFNADPAAMSAPVVTDHPDLYFYLAAASGAATLLLLLAGTVLPARRGRPRTGNNTPRRRPAPDGRGKGFKAPAAARRTPSRATSRRPAPRPAAPSTRVPTARTGGGTAKARSTAGTPATSADRPAARPASRR